MVHTEQLGAHFLHSQSDQVEGPLYGADYEAVRGQLDTLQKEFCTELGKHASNLEALQASLSALGGAPGDLRARLDTLAKEVGCWLLAGKLVTALALHWPAVICRCSQHQCLIRVPSTCPAAPLALLWADHPLLAPLA